MCVFGQVKWGCRWDGGIIYYIFILYVNESQQIWDLKTDNEWNKSFLLQIYSAFYHIKC